MEGIGSLQKGRPPLQKVGNRGRGKEAQTKKQKPLERGLHHWEGVVNLIERFIRESGGTFRKGSLVPVGKMRHPEVKRVAYLLFNLKKWKAAI